MASSPEKNAAVDGSGKPNLLRFGSFILDLQRHGLYQGDTRLRLTSKPFETLAVLVQHRGEIVGKQKLLDAVWKDAFVTEDSLVKAVREIRRVLEDEKGNPRFIQTVPGEGYRFIAEVTSADPLEKDLPTVTEVQHTKLAPEEVAIAEPVAGHRSVGAGYDRARVRFWMTAAGIGLLIAVSAVFFLRFGVNPRSPRQHPITNFAGSHTEASLSPDSTWLAFTSKDSNGVPQIWLKNMPEGEPHQLTHAEVPSHHASWSPRADEILFSRGVGWKQSIWSISPLGGTPRILIEGGRNPSSSSDGNRLVYEKDNEIWTANADGSDRRRVEGVPPIHLWLVDREPSLSPDGSQVAFFQPEDGPMGDFFIIPSSGGQARRLTFDIHLGGEPVWTPDGRYIVFSSQRRGSKTLWKILASGGTPEPVTTGAGEDTNPEISRDGKSLIFTNSRVYWTLTVQGASVAHKDEIKETVTDMFAPEFSPTGERIVFFATVDDGDIHLFTVRADGSDLRQVTRGKGERNVMPQWSADGKALYFYRVRPDLSFRKISIEGGESAEVAPGWRPRTHYGARVDSMEKKIVYSKLEKNAAAVTVIRDIATRKETPFKRTLDHARWSSVGRSIVGVDPESSTDGVHGDIVVCSVDNETCRTVASRGHAPIWSADDSQIYFTRNDSEIWSVALDGGREEPFSQTSQVDPIGSAFDLSRDGKVVYVQLKQGKQELWMTDFN